MKKSTWQKLFYPLACACALGAAAGLCACGGASDRAEGNEGGGKPQPPVAFEWAYRDLPTGGVEIFSETATATDKTLTVPAEIDGKQVRAIANNGLKGFANLQSVTFAEDCEIETIGSYAFADCALLASFSVPATVEALGDRVFSNCKQLSYVEIPVSVDSVGKNLFLGCNKGELDVYCAAVAKPNGWSDYYASNSTSASYKDFTFWWGAKKAEYSLKNYRACVVIDNTVAITHYDGKEENLVIPSEINGRPVSKLSKSSFEDCTTIQTVTFPEGLKEIAGYAFSGCTLLKSVTLPASAEKLGDCVFQKCAALEYAEIPLGVESAGKNLFLGCNKTKLDVYCAAAAKPDGWSKYYASNSTTAFYEDFAFWWGMKAAENSAKGFRAGVLTDDTVAITHYDGKEYDLVVPDEIGGKPVTKIMKNSFASANTVQTIQLPAQLKFIGGYAFEKCLLLQSVTLPSGVTEVGARAFTGCSALTSVYLPASVTALGELPFLGCNKNALTIYCGAASKPSGWAKNYASNSSTAYYNDFNFVWNASGIGG